MATKTKEPKNRVMKDHFACTMRGDSLASEGILDGYTLIADREAKAKPGDLALVRAPGGEVVAKRASIDDLPLVIGRVIQTYVIPRDSKYLILRNLKNW